MNFLRFLVSRGAGLQDVVPTDLFDYLDWQQRAGSTAGVRVVQLSGRHGAAPTSMNRRVAAVRGLFEFAVVSGLRADNPVPAARRSTGLRAKRRGPLGHIGPGRPSTGGRLVREPRWLPESLDREEISGFLADLDLLTGPSTVPCSSVAVSRCRFRAPIWLAWVNGVRLLMFP